MELENGQKIPQVGFGTWPMKGDECFDAVCSAIKIGYRFVSKFIAREDFSETKFETNQGILILHIIIRMKLKLDGPSIFV